MFEGELAAIFVAGPKREPRQRVDRAEAVAGHGLAGDRYLRKEGGGNPSQEVTLIESEALEALARECDIRLEPGQARRNLLTRGVPLNHLVGRAFAVGEVVLRGIRLCEPCDHLEGMTVAGVKQGLCHRGGLRAEVLRGGVLRTGDPIRPHADGPQP
jgi:MOSC domain-containing protein YiiM